MCWMMSSHLAFTPLPSPRQRTCEERAMPTQQHLICEPMPFCPIICVLTKLNPFCDSYPKSVMHAVHVAVALHSIAGLCYHVEGCLAHCPHQRSCMVGLCSMDQRMPSDNCENLSPAEVDDLCVDSVVIACRQCLLRPGLFADASLLAEKRKASSGLPPQCHHLFS